MYDISYLKYQKSTKSNWKKDMSIYYVQIRSNRIHGLTYVNSTRFGCKDIVMRVCANDIRVRGKKSVSIESSLYNAGE